MKLRMRLLLHQFCMTLLSERGESNKTNANKVSYKASYEVLDLQSAPKKAQMFEFLKTEMEL